MSGEMVELKRMATVTYGLSQPPPLADEGVPIVRATNIERGSISAKELIFAALEQLPLDRVPLLRAGELLVVRSGAYTGDSALVTPEWERSAPGYDLRVTPTPALEPRFGAYSLLGGVALDHMVLASSRAAQPHLNAEDLGGVPILRLAPREQRAIADFLDTETARIDALITKKRRIIDLLEERRWSEFRLATTETDAPRVPARRALVSVTDGPFGSAFTSGEYSDGGVAVIRLGNIGYAEFRDHDLVHLPLNRFAEFRQYAVRQGDILFAGLGDERNHAGRACVAPDLGPAIVKGKCFCGRIDTSRAVADFMALYFSSPMAASSLALEARGSTRQMINLEILKAVEVPLPSVERQMEIVEAVRRRWGMQAALHRSLNAQIGLLREHRQALITAAVAGDLEVPGVAA